jgi:hypothetical protein
MFAHPKRLEPSCKRGFLTRCLLASAFVLLLPTPSRADETPAEEPARPARPAPPPPLEPTKLPDSRHVDIGAAVALVQRVADGQTTVGAVRYPAGVGVGLSARVDVWRYLRANLYVVRASTTMDFAPGALGLPGDPGDVTITNYSFGLRLSPTLPLGPRARVWATFGAGWGRLEAGRFDVLHGGKTYQVRERAFSFVEFPTGLGFSVDIVKNWLAFEFEATGAFHAAERGTARENGQAIVDGRRTTVLPFPEIAVTFVETIGLALIL